MKLLPTRCFAACWLVLSASAALCAHNAAAQSLPDQPAPETTGATSVRPPQAQLLTEAQTYLNLESFDLADKRYRQVLALDPENDTALRGRTEVSDRRVRFEQDVADGRRSRMTTVKIPTKQNVLDAATVARKLQSIIIPLIDIHDLTLKDVLEGLRQDARKYDSDPTEEERGLNIFLKLPQTTARDPEIPGLPPSLAPKTLPNESDPSPVSAANTKITLRLENVSLLQALNQIAERAGLKIKVEPYAVSLVPFTEATDELFTEELRIPPAFLGLETESATPLPANIASPQKADLIGKGSLPTKRTNAKTFLESNGVTFPPGSSAVYLHSTQKLVIRNTRANLELVGLLRGEFKKLPQPAANP